MKRLYLNMYGQPRHHNLCVSCIPAFSGEIFDFGIFTLFDVTFLAADEVDWPLAGLANAVLIQSEMLWQG